jgi:hypothetical protein
MNGQNRTVYAFEVNQLSMDIGINTIDDGDDPDDHDPNKVPF